MYRAECKRIRSTAIIRSRDLPSVNKPPPLCGFGVIHNQQARVLSWCAGLTFWFAGLLIAPVPCPFRGGVARRVGFRRRSGHVADGHLSCLARWSHVHLLLAVHKRFVAVFVLVFALFGLLGGDPRRGLDLPRHFSEDHGKTSRSSHTSKEVDARWSTRATKHIGEEYIVNTREERKGGRGERKRGGTLRYCSKLAAYRLPSASVTFLRTKSRFFFFRAPHRQSTWQKRRSTRCPAGALEGKWRRGTRS